MKFSYVTIACVLGFAGVALGAFGAHALTSIVAPNRLEAWGTAVDYHLLHAVVIVALSGLFRGTRSVWLDRALRAFIAGIVVFSGSLYLLVVTDTPLLGAVTPVGGLLLLLGWVCAFVASLGLADND